MKIKHLYILIAGLLLIACDDSESLPNLPLKEKEIPADTVQNNPIPVDTTTNFVSGDLSIATWNVEFFPKNNNTVALINELIVDSDLDIIAFQEINDQSDFNRLDDLLSGFKGEFVNVSGSLDYAFLINSNLITDYQTSTILNGDGSAFPRAPAVLSFRLNGDQYRIINIHLKCCSGSESRRRDASGKLHAYIQSNYRDDHVILLGDFNDGIFDDNVFDAFLNDSDNFLFADEGIQNGPSTFWSYPSWPSHLDHIVISDEFFGYESQTETWLAERDSPSYFSSVSDHRPVIINIDFNK